MLNLAPNSHYPTHLIGDEAHLRQILLNLIGNAIKFTEQGSVTLRLNLQQANEAQLVIEIEDTGSGINHAYQQRIFEPFEQLNNDGINKGTGLGLTITRQFVELMHGKIDLISEPGSGALFIVTLPIQQIQRNNTSDKQPSEHVGVTYQLGTSPNTPPCRVLIVEDQLENQMLLSQLMGKLGIQYEVANNGQEAIELFSSWQPQLIWMDRKMPLLDGVAATQQIRQMPSGRDVKIIAVTASAFQEQREEMLQAGMDDFICKPYRIEEVCQCLTQHLDITFSSDFK